MTVYTKLGGTVAWNAGMGGALSIFKGDDLSAIFTNTFSAGLGSSMGYSFAGKPISYGVNQLGYWKSGGWDPKYNPKLQGGAINGLYGLLKDMKPSIVPSIAGNMGAAFITEITNTEIQEEIKYFNEQKREKDNEPKN